MVSTLSTQSKIALSVHICDLRPGTSSWGATVAVEGPVMAQGLVLAIFYEGRRLKVGQLDEWGYWMVELEDLPAPFNMVANTHFEVRSKEPPASYLSPQFHPPLVRAALQGFLERTREWPKHLPLRGAQLKGAQLGQANLQGVDFTGANLSEVKFRGANLQGAIFKDAQLDQTDFSSANLAYADLQGASLKNVDWTDVNLKGADLRNAASMSLDEMQNWLDLATLDDTQIARIRLSTLAKKQEETTQYGGHYRSSNSINLKANATSLAPVSEDIKGTSTSERTSVSTSYTSTSYGSSLQEPTINNKKASSAQEYDLDESKYYSFGKQPSKAEPIEEEEEEAPAWLPQLPPVKTLTDAEVEQRFQLERKMYLTKIAKYQQKRSLRGGVEFSLNMVPNGTFEMGSDQDEDNERPRHKVTLSYPLLVGETLVTQEFFDRVMLHSQFKFVGAKHPADSVSWSEAIDFCNRLSQLEGLKPAYELTAKGINWLKESNGYRLPTEAEWEYVARAGVDSLYSGSNDLDQCAWYQDNSKESSHEVAQKRENAWGLYDMSGNLWEWCYDTYQEDSYHGRGTDSVVDPVVEGEGPKVIRGGSWSFEAKGQRIKYRSRLSAKFKTSRVGFRIVRSPKLKMRGG